MNTCLIDGNCYSANEINPQNPYERCEPEQNATEWTAYIPPTTTPTAIGEFIDWEFEFYEF